MKHALSLAVALCLATAAVAQPVVFTGDVAADFPPTAAFIADPGGQDVGIPLAFPAGTISGWDMSQCALYYDAGTDTLFVGFDTYGIGGDADGDGNPGGTSAILAGLGGTDFAALGSTESAGVFLDLDDDGTFDVVAGVDGMSDLSNLRSANFSGSIFAAGFAYGAPLPNMPVTTNVPSAANPDLEFAIGNFTDILSQYLQPGQTSVGVSFFMGSFSDAGIGEDYVPEPTPSRVPVTTFCVGAQATVSYLPNTCGGQPGAPVLTVDPPAQGTIGKITLTSGQPNTHMWIWASVPPVNPWFEPLSGCTVYLDFLNPANFWLLHDTNTDMMGGFEACYTIPIVPAAVGQQLLIQARTWWPGGPVPGGDWLTDAALITVGCP